MINPRKPVFDAIVTAAGRNVFNDAGNIAALDELLDDFGVAREGEAHLDGPPWLTIARDLMGTKEIPGPRHNSWIAKGWARLGATWFNDDETPWCGLFVAHCIDAVGLEIPKPSQFPRAKAWSSWGKPCGKVLGAVAVFGRQGGGHVGFLVGESADNFYVLGGNQSNAVNITPIAKGRLVQLDVGGNPFPALRWPASQPLGTMALPRMSGGTVSVNEA